MRHIKRSALDEVKLVVPTRAVRAEFESIAQPMLAYVRRLNHVNANLRRTRDLLLPKLVSGEVDVARLAIAPGVESQHG